VIAAEDTTMDLLDGDWTHEELDGAEEIETALPLVLAGEGADLDLEAVDDVFGQVLARLAPVEAESMGSALRSIGRWAGDRARLGQLASTFLPTAATALGTVYGGPLGAAVGRSVGQRAAQAIAGAPRPAAPPGAAGPPPVAPPVAAPTPPAPAPTGAPGPPAGTAGTGASGSQAAAQLLYLVQNPSFLSSLVSLALGSQGRPTVPVGASNEEAPVGAFMTLARELAGEASEDADALLGGGETLSDSYLRDPTGCFTCDPAVPAQRARALLQRLQHEDEVIASLGESEAETWGDDLDGEWWQDEWWQDEW
jgi:hypothetical protein